MKSNKVIILCGPSGVGKATIEKFLFDDKDLNLSFSVSATTRDKREGEEDGKEYYFIDRNNFDKKIEANEFVEWNEHFSNKYGTLKSEIKRLQDAGHLPFIEVETFGAENIINQLGKENVISIFISPPSIEELEKRIRNRQTETDEQIKERMVKVSEELSKINLFDINVVNDVAETAAEETKDYILSRL